MIRWAEATDLARLVEMGDAFHKAAGHEEPHIREDFAKTLSHLLGPDGILLTSEQGMIGGLVFPCYFNFSVRWAQELFWWSTGGDGLELLEAFEREAEKIGVRKVILSRWERLRPKAVDRVLRSRGYVPIETSYEKVF